MINSNTKELKLEDLEKYAKLGMYLEWFLDFYGDIETEIDGVRFTMNNCDKFVEVCDKAEEY